MNSGKNVTIFFIAQQHPWNMVSTTGAWGDQTPEEGTFNCFCCHVNYGQLHKLALTLRNENKSFAERFLCPDEACRGFNGRSIFTSNVFCLFAEKFNMRFSLSSSPNFPKKSRILRQQTHQIFIAIYLKCPNQVGFSANIVARCFPTPPRVLRNASDIIYDSYTFIHRINILLK